MSDTLVNIVGIVGCLLILFAFYRTSIGRWTGRSLWFELDNLIGAACLTYYSYEKAAYVNVILNLIWVAVALKGVTSIADRRAVRRRSKT